MGSFAIFNNGAYMIISLIALLILFLSCFFTEKGSRIKLGIWLLFFAMVVDFAAGWIEAEAASMYSIGSAYYTYMLYAELSLFLGEMLLLAVAASLILLNKIPSLMMIGGAAGFAVVCIVYFLFISQNGNAVFQMRYIFPMVGFAYFAASLWAKFNQRFSSGYIFAAVVASLSASFLFLRLIRLPWVTDDAHIWFVPALVNILFALSFIIIRINFLSFKLSEAKVEIEKNNRRLQEIVKSSPFPIIISKLSDDKIIMANNNAVKLFGILPQEAERYRLRDFFVDVENRRLLTERLEREREVQDFEILVKTPTGDTPFWLLASANIIDYNNDVALYAAFQDITSRKNREMLLKNQAIRDPLTSLYNRRYFEEEVFNRILCAKTAREDYSVLMIDADHFKRVNDTYGHKVGDKVLIELAATAEKALRENDIVARYGGEEFVIYLDKVNADKAKIVAERLRESMAAIVVYSDEGEEVRFTVSIGLSSSEVSDNVETLIKTADEALYRAKQTGRNRVEIFRQSDLQHFNDISAAERKTETLNHHPIFDKEDSQEISLLDGIPSNQIQENDVQIEENAANMALPGVDDDDLR